MFNKRVFVRNEMLRDDAIYNSSFRFRNINLNNVNDIYFAINIIVIIATTLLEALIALFIFEFIIVIIINIDVNVVVITAIVIVIVPFVIVFKRLIFKFIAFDLDIKDCLAMNASFDKS